MRSKQYLISFAATLLVGSLAYAGAAGLYGADDPPTKRRELEAKRKQLTTEIRQTNALLSATTAAKKTTAAEYELLQKQVRNREEVVRVIKAEIVENDLRAERAELLIASLESDMKRLEIDHGTMMRAAYRYTHSQSELLFLFSANGVNDAYKRYQYLHRYNEYRKRQAQLVIETKKSLEEQRAELSTAREQKIQLLAAEQEHTAALATEAATKNKAVKALSRKESDLRTETDRLEAQKESLNSAIEAAIRGSVKASKTNARSGTTTAIMPTLSAEGKTLDAEFGKNRGRLPSPIVGGVVTERFGTHPHPLAPTLTVSNNGLTFRAPVDAEVRAVFEGKVHSVSYVTGNEYCVLIEHGGYYTIYAQLGRVTVKKGDKVAVKQAIGTVGRNGTAHFELWHATQKLNPEVWLSR